MTDNTIITELDEKIATNTEEANKIKFREETYESLKKLASLSKFGKKKEEKAIEKELDSLSDVKEVEMDEALRQHIIKLKAELEFLKYDLVPSEATLDGRRPLKVNNDMYSAILANANGVQILEAQEMGQVSSEEQNAIEGLIEEVKEEQIGRAHV